MTHLESSIPELSIVTPVYNEADGIAHFAELLRSQLDAMKLSYEVIFVDDGSTDDSSEILNSLGWKQARTLSFVSNSGHMAALEAGYRNSSGWYVISMDSDLQHPIEMIPELLKTAKANKSEVVYAVRSSRNEDSFFKRQTANLYYKIIRWFSGIPIQDSAADFRLISKQVVDVIKSLPKGNLVFRLLIPSLGFPTSTVEYIAAPRFAGSSKYNLKKMVGLSTTSLVSFSSKPLTLAIQLGLIVSGLAVLGFIYAIASYFSGNVENGWASLISTILLLFGVLFVVLGIHGLYVGAILRNTLSRPTYVIKNTPGPDSDGLI